MNIAINSNIITKPNKFLLKETLTIVITQIIRECILHTKTELVTRLPIRITKALTLSVSLEVTPFRIGLPKFLD